MIVSVKVSPEVEDAVRSGRPVVALESTIISHGMPYPHNVEMAREVETIVRGRGATPATIAVIDGVCTIGVTDEQIESLASRTDVLKATTRDLPFLVATEANRRDDGCGDDAPRGDGRHTSVRDGWDRWRAPRRVRVVRHLG